MKLEQLKELFTPLYVLGALILIACLLIFLIRFFEYYDLTLERKDKENDNHIKNIVRKELKDYDNNVNE